MCSNKVTRREIILGAAANFSSLKIFTERKQKIVVRGHKKATQKAYGERTASSTCVWYIGFGGRIDGLQSFRELGWSNTVTMRVSNVSSCTHTYICTTHFRVHTWRPVRARAVLRATRCKDAFSSIRMQKVRRGSVKILHRKPLSLSLSLSFLLSSLKFLRYLISHGLKFITFY